jgi:hypothetical protein
MKNQLNQNTTFEKRMFYIAMAGVLLFAGYLLCGINSCAMPLGFFSTLFWPTLIAIPALMFGLMYSTTNEEAHRAYTRRASVFVWVSMALIFLMSLDNSSSSWAAPSVSQVQVAFALIVVFVLSSTVGYIYRLTRGELKREKKV